MRAYAGSISNEPDPPVAATSAERHGTHWVKHPVGTAVAALLLVASMVLYVMSGNGSAAAHGNGNGDGGSAPTTSVFLALPACRVDVSSNGIGSQRHHHVTVVLDNDLPQVWLSVESSLGTRTIEVPARNGWAQFALPAEEEPAKVVVYGSAKLVSYTAGCAWSAGL